MSETTEFYQWTHYCTLTTTALFCIWITLSVQYWFLFLFSICGWTRNRSPTHSQFFFIRCYTKWDLLLLQFNWLTIKQGVFGNKNQIRQLITACLAEAKVKTFYSYSYRQYFASFRPTSFEHEHHGIHSSFNNKTAPVYLLHRAT